MAGFTSTEWLSAPPEVAFEFSLEPKNTAKYITGTESMEQITPGPIGVGTRMRETRRYNGREIKTIITVTAYQPPTRYSVKAKQSGFTITYHYTFKPENGGTRVNLKCEVEAGGLKKLAIPVVVAAIQNEDSDHLGRLKQAIESEHPGSTQA